MNAMIPNEVRFDLDLQDLPARAIGVDQESMMKISGGCRRYFYCYSQKNGNVVAEVTVWWGRCQLADADWACNRQAACLVLASSGGCIAGNRS
jgi:hypothetical protein